MTSAANPQIQLPASTSTASTPSYASAAGSSQKPKPAPVIASGTPNPTTAPPVVVGSSQHAKSSSVNPTNGRPPITPAVPPVAHGSANISLPDQSRKSSVTISATPPVGHIGNGGSISVPNSSIQFGSPSIAHSSPHKPSAAPIQTAGRVKSPNPPSPIPQPSASGGRIPPSSAQDPQMRFGSFPGNGDGERHLNKHASHQLHNLGAQQGPSHFRRESFNSQHGDTGHHMGPGANRGGYQGQGNRGGRGGYSNYHHNARGFPPPQPYAGPNPNRPSSLMGRGTPPYSHSSQAQRGSPAAAHAVAHQSHQHQHQGIGVTPSMQYSMPMAPQNQNPYVPMQHMMPPQMGYPYHQMMPGPFFPPPVNFVGPPQSPAANFGHTNAYGQPPATAGQPMSRNPSQVSERPASSTGPTQGHPSAPGAHPPNQSQSKPPVVSSSSFVKPTRTAAVRIMTPDGEQIQFKQTKNLMSPASNLQQSSGPPTAVHQSHTPPVVSSTPTPPQHSSTPSHAPSDSTSSNNKTSEIRKMFQEQVRKQAASPVEPAEPTKAPGEQVTTDEPAQDSSAATSQVDEPSKEQDKPSLTEKAAAEAPTAEKFANDPSSTSPATKADEEVKDEMAKVEDNDTKPPVAAKAQPEKATEGDNAKEDEFERMVREMEEADARREQEQAAITAKKEAEKVEAKRKAEEVKRAADAEYEMTLKEQEAENERLELERQAKRAVSKDSAVTVVEALAASTGKTKPVEAPAAAQSTSGTTDATSKLANLTISAAEDTPSAPPSAKSSTTEKRGKPVPLNLAPLKTKTVEAPQPSAALQSLKSARFLDAVRNDIYPQGVASPNPALNVAVSKKGKTFRYDAQFLLQFQKVFTEQPSTEFHRQVKSLIGEPDGGARSGSSRGGPLASTRQNSRSGPGSSYSNYPPNNFGAFTTGKVGSGPVGMTSEQRFQVSTIGRPGGSTYPRVANVFGGGPPNPMSRTPSAANMAIPNSPRQGSARSSSKRNTFNAKADAQAAKTMPLTQGVEVKPISISATGWKPISAGNKAGSAASAAGGHLDPEIVQRKVKAALNKMTPEKFDKISDQILTIAAQSRNETNGQTLRQVIQLTFEKATDEAHWASMYAKFCNRMLESISPEIRDANLKDKYGRVVSGGALFRKYLLNSCQEEFERGWKVDLPKPKEGSDVKAGEAVMLSDEYYIAAAAKRRGLGLVQFIGELFKLGMLTERIMHECIQRLLEFQGIPDQAEIESLTKLLRTIGGALDAAEKSRPIMEAYFERIATIVDLPGLPSRLKFMLMDIVDLRKANWHSREINKGPKTLEEVRADAVAQAAQKQAENARNSQRGPPMGRPPAGRGDVRSFSGYGQAPNTLSPHDLSRLKSHSTRSPSQGMSLGPTSMFSSRSNSGRRLGAGGPLGRAGEDSGATSRTGTPPVLHKNAFDALAATTDNGDSPGSPPSTSASPALAKVALDTAAAGQGKKPE